MALLHRDKGRKGLAPVISQHRVVSETGSKVTLVLKATDDTGDLVYPEVEYSFTVGANNDIAPAYSDNEDLEPMLWFEGSDVASRGRMAVNDSPVSTWVNKGSLEFIGDLMSREQINEPHVTDNFVRFATMNELSTKVHEGTEKRLHHRSFSIFMLGRLSDIKGLVKLFWGQTGSDGYGVFIPNNKSLSYVVQGGRPAHTKDTDVKVIENEVFMVGVVFNEKDSIFVHNADRMPVELSNIDMTELKIGDQEGLESQLDVYEVVVYPTALSDEQIGEVWSYFKRKHKELSGHLTLGELGVDSDDESDETEHQGAAAVNMPAFGETVGDFVQVTWSYHYVDDRVKYYRATLRLFGPDADQVDFSTDVSNSHGDDGMHSFMVPVSDLENKSDHSLVVHVAFLDSDRKPLYEKDSLPLQVGEFARDSEELEAEPFGDDDGVQHKDNGESEEDQEEDDSAEASKESDDDVDEEAGNTEQSEEADVLVEISESIADEWTHGQTVELKAEYIIEGEVDDGLTISWVLEKEGSAEATTPTNGGNANAITPYKIRRNDIPKLKDGYPESVFGDEFRDSSIVEFDYKLDKNMGIFMHCLFEVRLHSSSPVIRYGFGMFINSYILPSKNTLFRQNYKLPFADEGNKHSYALPLSRDELSVLQEKLDTVTQENFDTRNTELQEEYKDVILKLEKGVFDLFKHSDSEERGYIQFLLQVLEQRFYYYLGYEAFDRLLNQEVFPKTYYNELRDNSNSRIGIGVCLGGTHIMDKVFEKYNLIGNDHAVALKVYARLVENGKLIGREHDVWLDGEGVVALLEFVTAHQPKLREDIIAYVLEHEEEIARMDGRIEVASKVNVHIIEMQDVTVVLPPSQELIEFAKGEGIDFERDIKPLLEGGLNDLFKQELAGKDVQKRLCEPFVKEMLEDDDIEDTYLGEAIISLAHRDMSLKRFYKCYISNRDKKIQVKSEFYSVVCAMVKKGFSPDLFYDTFYSLSNEPGDIQDRFLYTADYIAGNGISPDGFCKCFSSLSDESTKIKEWLCYSGMFIYEIFEELCSGLKECDTDEAKISYILYVLTYKETSEEIIKTLNELPEEKRSELMQKLEEAHREWNSQSENKENLTNIFNEFFEEQQNASHQNNANTTNTMSPKVKEIVDRYNEIKSKIWNRELKPDEAKTEFGTFVQVKYLEVKNSDDIYHDHKVRPIFEEHTTEQPLISITHPDNSNQFLVLASLASPNMDATRGSEMAIGNLFDAAGREGNIKGVIEPAVIDQDLKIVKQGKLEWR